MTGEKRILEMIRNDIALLTEERAHQVYEYARSYRLTLSHGGTVAAIALCLVAAEQAAINETDTVAS